MTKRNARLSANGRQAVLQLEDEAAEYGLARTTDLTGRPRYEATCAIDGRKGGMFNARIQSVEQVVTHLRKQGWVLNAKQPPFCSTKCARQAKVAKSNVAARLIAGEKDLSVGALIASAPELKDQGGAQFSLIQSAFEQARDEKLKAKRAETRTGRSYTVFDPGLTALKERQVLDEAEYRAALAECGKDAFTIGDELLNQNDHRARFVLAWSTPLADKVRDCSMTLEAAYRQAKEERNRVNMTSTPKPPSKPAAPLWGPKTEPARPTHDVVTPPPAIPPNPKITRRVVTLLNDHFDADKRIYCGGWSDERIAKEGDAALEFVINYRRQAYAELAEDPEATKIRAQITDLEERLFQAMAEIDELRAKLERWVADKAYNKARG